MSFKLTSKFEPTGDQPNAITQLVEGINKNEEFQVLLGVTGSGKTFTMANVIEQVQRPTLILTHNIKLDAAALKLVQSSSAKYVGLLGPNHRTDRVLDFANMTRSNLLKPLANPVGLRLGGELPESIALSMLAEAHAVLENADASSISEILRQ